ncbi:uncharacterized protein LOC122395309 [Colletes gigas]|uniref:uncharacterized protein LOC122395309 n=1 Tax=Colletes gigas TaxID=935657 RepID=UPI001C9B8505|nr:uncharacterized protein LOC122395309 [Colletes gigas]
MPSFLGHFLGFSFRTELLIMNLVGLINSTLDWSPLKWTNELERISNLSLSQSALILDTIGEDTIKTVLSWIVITRIVIAHVYTFTYVTNIYPVITWSRPNLLLPWLILSFFKNVVLEVIVIVIGLLLWYESRFSIFVFLEFIFVKLVPLLMATYNWYSNSCLFLQLRHTEKTRKLKRSMRSDTNLLATRLYTMLEDSKYRTRSLTTLLSCESHETYDTQDTILHIIDDSDLTPVQKTMKLLGLNERDIEDARIRVRERAAHRRLTELDDESVIGFAKRDTDRLLNSNNRYSQLAINDEPLNMETDSRRGKETIGRSAQKQIRRSAEKCCSPVKLQTLFNCNCSLADRTFDGKGCCEMNDIALRTSTPKSNVDDASIDANADQNFVRKTFDQPYVYSFNVTNVKTDFLMSNSLPAIENLLQSNLKMFKNESLDNNLLRKDVPVQKVLKEGIQDDVRDLSEIVHNLPATNKAIRVESTNTTERETVIVSKASTDDDVQDLVEKSELQVRASELDEDDSKLKSFEHSSIGTNISRFYKDSMMVFDGCYEKDFANNSELQCLLRQLEKKKWDVFAGETNLETLRAATFPEQNKSVRKMDKYEEIERYQAPVSTAALTTNPKEDRFLIPPEVQANRESGNETRQKSRKVPPVDSTKSIRNVCTQTETETETEMEMETNGSRTSLTEKKKRNRMFYVRKRFNDQTRSVSPASNAKFPAKKINSRFSVSTNGGAANKSPSASARQKLGKSASDDSSKKLDPVKSSSNKSVCDCKMQKLEAKYCGSSSESRFDKKNEPNRKFSGKQPKVDSFRTLPLGYTDRQPETEAEASTYRRKPPVYPRRSKREAQSVSSVVVAPAKIPPTNKMESFESKRSCNNGSKAFKSRYRARSITEELHAQEMRILKAYNEVTLLKDKKELEAKRRLSSGRDSEVSKSHPRASNRNSDSSGKGTVDDANALYDDYLNKENLLLDTTTTTTTEMEPLNSHSYSRFPKIDSNVASAKTARNNFDRLRVSQTGQNIKKEKPATESDNRKRYTKYSRPKKLDDQGNVSITSSKKLEGTQKGRDLDRTPAREDVRDETASSQVPFVGGLIYGLPSRKYLTDIVESLAKYDRTTGLSTSENPTIPQVRDDEDSLMTIVKGTVNEGIVSSSSSSIMDREKEIEAVLEECGNQVEDQAQTIPETDQDVAEPPAPVGSPWPVDVQENTETRAEVEENSRNQRTEYPRNEPYETYRRSSPDMTDFVRNIDVTSLVHGVVLANTNAQGRKSRQYDIVDDTTAKMVHDAFSYKSMDSLLDFPDDIVAMENVINNSHLESSSDEFVCRLSNEFAEDRLISQQHNQLEQAIMATIRESQDENQTNDDYSLCIIAIDSDNLPDIPELEIVDDYDHVEGLDQAQHRADDVLTSLTEVLGNINIAGLNLDAIAAMKLELLQKILNVDAKEENEECSEEEEEEEDEDDEPAFRIIEKDICTNIKFPIMVKMSDWISGVPDIENFKSRRSIASIGYVQSIRFPLVQATESKEVKEETIDAEHSGERPEEETEELNSLKKFVRSMFATTFDILRKSSTENVSDSEESSTCDASAKSFDNSKLRSTIESSKFDADRTRADPRSGPWTGGPRKGFNETFEIINVEDPIEWSEEIDQSVPRLGKNQGEIAEIGEIERVDEQIFEDCLDMEELSELEELEDLIAEQGSENNESVEKPDVQVDNIVALKEEISLKIVLSFWLIVLYFYIRYFYLKIYSLAQISRSTSTLKPFEVHAASTSTSTLLENAKLAERIREESLPKEDEGNESFERSTDLEDIDISTFIEQQLETVPSLTLDGTFSGNVGSSEREHVLEEIREVEKTIISLRECVAEMIEGSLFSKSVAENLERRDIVQTSDNDFSSAKESSAIATNTRFSIIELEDQDLIELHAPEGNIETFRFKEIDRSGSSGSLLGDTREEPSENSKLNDRDAEARIDKEGPRTEQIENYGRGENERGDEIWNLRDAIDVNQRVSTDQNVEEAKSVEKDEPVNFETTLEEMDSFDSAYTMFSETSQRVNSYADFYSTMEEFSVASDTADKHT